MNTLRMKDNLDSEATDFIGDNHVSTSAKTPLRNDAFEKTNDEKIALIKEDVTRIMETLGLDLEDDSLKGTPNRVAKMFVKEIFGGLNPESKPKASVFDNNYSGSEWPSLITSFKLICIIVFGTTAYYLLNVALRLGEISVVTPFRYTRILFALIIGMMIFKEKPDSLTIMGSIIIICSGIYTLFRNKASNKNT